MMLCQNIDIQNASNQFYLSNHFYQMKQTLQDFDQDYVQYQSEEKKLQIALAAHYVATYLKMFELHNSYLQIYDHAQKVKKCLNSFQQISQGKKGLQKKITDKLDHLKTKYINPFNFNIAQKEETQIIVSSNQGEAKLLQIFENDKQLNIDQKIIIEQVFFQTKMSMNEVYLQSYKEALAQVTEQIKQVEIKRYLDQQNKHQKLEKYNSFKYLVDLSVNIYGEIMQKAKKIPPSNKEYLKNSIVKAGQQHNTINWIQSYAPIDQNKICCLEYVQKDSLILFDHPVNDGRDQNMIFIEGQITNKDNQIAVKKAICSLLNYNGGFIFFGFKKQFFSYKVVGQLLDQNQKDELYQQKIGSWMKQILLPSITVSNKNEIHIEFIPLLKEKDIPLNAKIQKQKLQFQRGMYIVRIKVFARGLAAEKAYRINNGGLTQFCKYDQNEKKVSVVQKDQIYKLISSNYNGYHHYGNKLENTRKNLPIIHCHFKQERNPQKGNFLHKKQENNAQYSPKKQQTYYENEKPEQIKFKYVNLIVYEKTYQNKVLDHLKQHKVQYKVERRFDYKICAKTHVFHHNEKFDKISSMLEELKFGHQRNKDKTKKAFLISVNPTVFYKITKNQNTLDVKSLLQQVRKKVGLKQNIQVFEYPKERGVYLKTTSIDTALFVYFYILDKKYQAKFKKLPNELRHGQGRSNNQQEYKEYQPNTNTQMPTQNYNPNQFSFNGVMYYQHSQDPRYWYDQFNNLGVFYNNMFYPQYNMYNMDNNEMIPNNQVNYTNNNNNNNYNSNQVYQNSGQIQKQKYENSTTRNYDDDEDQDQDDYDDNQDDYDDNYNDRRSYGNNNNRYNNSHNSNNKNTNNYNNKSNNYRGGNNNNNSNRDYGNTSYRGNNRR